MSIQEIAAWVGTGILAALIVFQILLALGLPLGRAAWGGRHRVLPSSLRLGSLAAVAILAVAAWILLARVGLVPPGADRPSVRIFAWVFASYFGLNVLMNLFSRSKIERAIMMPASALLFASYLTVLLVRA